MSATPSPYQPDVDPPTVPLRLAGGQAEAAPDKTRWLMWAAVAGALVAVVLAAAMVVFSGGTESPRPSGAAAMATGAAAPEAAEPEVTGGSSASASASPSSSPSAKPSPRPSLRPVDLIAGLHTTVLGLVRDGQLDDDGGEELTKRLREAAEKLADGEVDKARDKLAEFGEKVAKLREEDELSSSGYQALAAGLRQLVALLPNR